MQDYVDEAWEVLRLRRLKASLIAAIAHRGLRETLLPLVGDTQAEALAAAWAVRKSDASTEIERALASAGLTMEAVVAQTFVAHTRRNREDRSHGRHRAGAPQRSCMRNRTPPRSAGFSSGGKTGRGCQTPRH